MFVHPEAHGYPTRCFGLPICLRASLEQGYDRLWSFEDVLLRERVFVLRQRTLSPENRKPLELGRSCAREIG